MDITPIAGAGARKVNLWHGVPLKKIERDITQEHHAIAQAYRGSWPTRLANKLLRPQLTERYDHVLATSQTTAERFSSAFGVSPSQIILAGYPRTDPLLQQGNGTRYALPEERALIEELTSHSRRGRRVLLYMPTFRDWENTADRQIPIDWPAINRALGAHGGVLYCKLHPGDQARLPDLSGFEWVRLIPTNIDPYPLLKHTDALVTDYSSIFFDYLLIDKPIVFYPYDLERYQRYSRGLYDRYEDVTPGPKASNAAELTMVLARLLSHYSETHGEWRDEMERIRTKAHQYRDGKSSERLLRMLFAELRISP